MRWVERLRRKGVGRHLVRDEASKPMAGFASLHERCGRDDVRRMIGIFPIDLCKIDR